MNKIEISAKKIKIKINKTKNIYEKCNSSCRNLIFLFRTMRLKKQIQAFIGASKKN